MSVIKTTLTPERMHGESLKAYKARRTATNKRLRAFLRGHVVWDSKTQGTFMRGQYDKRS